MKKIVLSAAMAVIALLSFFAGARYHERADQVAGADNRVNPVSFQRKGTGANDAAPMERHGEDRAGEAREQQADLSTTPGAVKISPLRQQLIGVEVDEVRKTATRQMLHTLGRVAADETRIYRLNSAVDGWIREVGPFTVGSMVKKDDSLASFYAPEFLAAEQAYFFGLASFDRFQATGNETPGQIALTKANIQQYKDSLRNLGMGELQIEQLGRTRQLTENIAVTSPVTGFVITRNIYPGQRFEKGTEFYRLADLARVWILADIFENEAHYFRPGAIAVVTLPYQQKSIRARVSDVLPQFDPDSRTFKVRLEADNPGFALRPGMFVDVDLAASLPPAVTVPADAVLDSGLWKIVFVSRGNGLFEPRQVETGWRFNDRIEIVSGLSAGERIVVSGNFLINSESRMKNPAAEAGKEPPAAGTAARGDRNAL